MSLVLPHNFKGIKIDDNAFENNLSFLLNPTEVKNVTTQLALDAFAGYEAAQTTLMQKVYQYTVSTLSYAAPISFFAISILTTGYKVAKNISLNSVTAALYENKPLVSATGIKAVDAIVVYSSPQAIVGTIGSLFAMDTVSKKITGVAPIRASVVAALGLLLTIPLIASQRLSEMTTASFVSEEQDRAFIRATLHSDIIDQNKKLYDSIADGLINIYNEAINHPAEIIMIKEKTQTILSNFWMIKKQLLKLKLNSLEIDKITEKLFRATKIIIDAEIQFRETKSAVDNAYNFEVLRVLSFDELAKNALTIKAKKFLEMAKENTLGTIDKVKSLTTGIVSGVTKSLSVELAGVALIAAPVCYLCPEAMEVVLTCVAQNDKSATACLNSLILPVLGSPFASYVGWKETNRQWTAYTIKEKMCRKNKRSHELAAREDLKAIYGGMTDYLKANFEKFNQQEKNIVLKCIPELITKLVVMEKEIFRSGVPYHQVVTQDLKKYLQELVD